MSRKSTEPFNNEIFEAYRIKKKNIEEAIILLENNGYKVTKANESGLEVERL